jgi:hypothetical protein
VVDDLDALRAAALLEQPGDLDPLQHTAPKRSASASTVRTSRASSVWQS